MSEHLPECPKSGCPACVEQGQRDALAEAVQRVEAHLALLAQAGWSARLEGIDSAVIAGFGPGIAAAIKGEQ